MALAFGYGPNFVFGQKPNEDEKEEDKEGGKRFFHAQFGMFTYYNNAWTLKRSAWGPLDDIGKFEKLCAKDPYVLSLWDKRTEEFQEKVVKLQVGKWAYSFEPVSYTHLTLPTNA